MKKLLKGAGLFVIGFATSAGLFTEVNQTTTTTEETSKATSVFAPATLNAADVTGSVSVKVVDENGYGLGGVQFTAFNSANVATAVMTTDENGETTSKPIPAGKYTIRQTGEPNGYYSNKTYYYATITSQDQVVDINGGANVINYPVPTNKAGNITGKIVDDQGYGIAGVKFTIYNTRNIPVAYVTTDENGEFVSKELESGKYTIRQTGQPSAYYDNKAYYTAEITSDGQQVPINGGSNIINHKIAKASDVRGTISATVVDESQNPVSGVTFTIFDSRNISVGTMTTDGTGKAQLDNLVAGNYTIRQTGQPSAYYDNKTFYYATIDQAGEQIDINNTQAIVAHKIAGSSDTSTQEATTTSGTSEESSEPVKQAKTAKQAKSTTSEKTNADAKEAETKKASEEEPSLIENIMQSISDFVVNIIDSVKNTFS